jgi:release factor glutamine methyltransferase
MQLRDALSEAVEMLERNDVGSPRMNAEVLLMLTLNCDRTFLFGHPERELSEDEETRYASYIRERARGVPSQYITGHQEFWGLDFIVTPAVLIPRPETEHIVEVVKELAGLMEFSGRRPKLIDVGTGSGAIAIALAKELPAAEVMAVDLSAEALEVTKLNAVRLEVADRVRIAKSDVMAEVERNGSFDFVASNPPYVALSEADKVQDVVKKFEPKMAVFAGEHGFDVIDRLIPQAHEALRPGGYLVMEIGYSMSQATMDRLADWEDVHAVPDLAGIPRVVVARKKQATVHG